MGVFSDQEAAEQNPQFAVGGRIEGAPSGTDSIPIWAASGYIILKEESSAYKSVLARMNAGWHEGEGCSVNSCCCDPMEANQ